ncbi:hypothetical protein GQ43DRAFT_31185 [Delitschia confertaspora ATCC 74209]|uniref:Uncharacterized protein n=1 Tax=Delitschia confertaspora ATCC 74209 TaxID=1513339 RepID=A0A9P4MVZ0_9PLEO|nr:hypothetical protein GQ43DRAFT_31185 [Delitschia confertaspora ATCC 74209]
MSSSNGLANGASPEPGDQPSLAGLIENMGYRGPTSLFTSRYADDISPGTSQNQRAVHPLRYACALRVPVNNTSNPLANGGHTESSTETATTPDNENVSIKDATVGTDDDDVGDIDDAVSNNAIATKEQIEASGMAHGTSLLAVIDKKLGEEVKEHITRFAESISRIMINTHKLLEMLHVSIKAEGGKESDLKIVEQLWTELEQIFQLVTETTTTALPKFLHKQKVNLTLGASAAVQDTLNQAHSILATQHDQIASHHATIGELEIAFSKYRRDTDSKLKDLTDLQERVSRLTMSKSLLKEDMVKAKAEVNAGLKLNKKLQQQKDAVQAEKAELAAENGALKKAVKAGEEKLTKAVEETKQLDSPQMHHLTEELGKEAQKYRTLQEQVTASKKSELRLKDELEQIQSLQNMQAQKFSNQSVEFAKLLQVNKNLTELIARTKSEVSATKAENPAVQQKLMVLNEVKVANESIAVEQAELKHQIKTLEDGLASARQKYTETCQQAAKSHNEAVKLHVQMRQFQEDNDQLKRENQRMEIEHNRLRTDNTKLIRENSQYRAEHEKFLQGLHSYSTLKAPNAKKAASYNSGSRDEVMAARIQVLEEQIRSFERQKYDWEELGTVHLFFIFLL